MGLTWRLKRKKEEEELKIIPGVSSSGGWVSGVTGSVASAVARPQGR